MLAASLAEVTQALIRNPFEVVKQNMQVGHFTSVSQSLGNIWRQKGFAGFYQGYFSLIMREIPFSAIQLPLYERLKIVCLQAKAK